MGSNSSKTDYGRMLLTQALQRGDVDFLRSLHNQSLLKGHIRFKSDFNGLFMVMSPLHISAAFGHAECLEYLLSNGANVDDTDASRETALHCAIMCNPSKTVTCLNILLESKANINSANIWKRTPLMKAVVNFKFVAAKYLIKEGADVNIADENGTSPLIVSASYNDTDVSMCLLQNGADINWQDVRGRTALYFAILGGHLKMTAFLLGSDCNTNLFDDGWGSPLQLAVTKCNVRILKLLLNAGVQTEATGSNKTPVFVDVLLKIVNRRVSIFRGDISRSESATNQTYSRAVESLQILQLLIVSSGYPIKENVMSKIHQLVTKSYHEDLHEKMMMLHSCAVKAYNAKGNNPNSLQQITRHRCRELLMNSRKNVVWACERLDVPRVVKELCRLES